MNLDIAIEQLLEAASKVRAKSFADDKTPLGNALALSREKALINIGQSEFDVIVFGDLNDFKHLNDTHTHSGKSCYRKNRKENSKGIHSKNKGQSISTKRR